MTPEPEERVVIDLEVARQLYAEEVRAVSNVRSVALLRAFSTVPRERFLGPGPWQILRPGSAGMLSGPNHRKC